MVCQKETKLYFQSQFSMSKIDRIFSKTIIKKINILKGNHCILRIRGGPVRLKLGMILENKVVLKLKLEKNGVFYKKWSPKLIFLNEFFFEKICLFLT